MSTSASTTPAIAESYQYCRKLTRQFARNFDWGLRLLPEPKRSHMYALYAWMRLADDIADAGAAASAADRRGRLEDWQRQTHAIIAREPADAQPIWPAFADMVHTCQIPARIFDDAIAGQAQDLAGPTFANFADLREYCYRVAGTVGLASIHIWGFAGGAKTESMAIDLGVAMQLTNILRDLREDQRRGRFYLPLDELSAAKLDPTNLGQFPDQLTQFMHQQIARAQSLYDAARDLPQRISPDSRAALVAMTRIYHALLDKIARRPLVVLRRRVRLSWWTKLRIGYAALRSARV